MPNTKFISKLDNLLSENSNDSDLFKAIVNAPFNDRHHATLLSLGVVVLLLVNKQTNTIDRIALSDTEPATGAVSMSAKPFHQIKIPVNHKGNLIAQAIATNRYQQTDDWQYLFVPELTPEEARFNQAGAGIGCSVIYPLECRDGGAMIFSYYEPPQKIGAKHHDFMEQYASTVCRRLTKND
jgi:hypothetical protein